MRVEAQVLLCVLLMGGAWGPAPTSAVWVEMGWGSLRERCPWKAEGSREKHGVWFSQGSLGEGRRSTEPRGLQCVDEGDGVSRGKLSLLLSKADSGSWRIILFGF